MKLVKEKDTMRRTEWREDAKGCETVTLKLEEEVFVFCLFLFFIFYEEFDASRKVLLWGESHIH